MASNARVGNQTVFYSPFEPFHYAIKNCFDAFEWFPDKPYGQGWDVGQVGTATRRYIKDTAQMKDMGLSVHAMLPGNPLKAGDMKGIYSDIEFAKEIGASVFNIHLYRDAPLEAYAKAVQPIIGMLEEAGIRLSIENTALTSPEDFNELFDILKGEREVGMCFDLGHANLFAPTRNNYLEYANRLKAPIIHLHLHENWGNDDSHLTVFTGPSSKDPGGLAGVIDKAKENGFNGSIILEQWPDPPELLAQARKRLKRMLEDEKT